MESRAINLSIYAAFQISNQLTDTQTCRLGPDGNSMPSCRTGQWGEGRGEVEPNQATRCEPEFGLPACLSFGVGRGELCSPKVSPFRRVTAAAGSEGTRKRNVRQQDPGQKQAQKQDQERCRSEVHVARSAEWRLYLPQAQQALLFAVSHHSHPGTHPPTRPRPSCGGTSGLHQKEDAPSSLVPPRYLSRHLLLSPSCTSPCGAIQTSPSCRPTAD